MVDEVEQSLHALKAGRTGAEDGLVAEMLKTGHRGLVEALASFFDAILQGRMDTPESWRRTKLKVIFKKGDLEIPSNYRLISIISVMAKPYITILYKSMCAV